jgi:hypothetical protein
MENLEKSFLPRAFGEWISGLHFVPESGKEYIQTWQNNFASHPVP